VRKITPCLWFDDDAEQAARFYASIFKRSKIGRITRYGKEGYAIHGRKAGTVMTVTFRLDGQAFMALNGGPVFTFNEAVSFIVHCRTQREVDYYWARLSRGGKKGVCGWLKDKYGVSWQIVPTVLDRMLRHKTTARSERVMKALLRMRKLDINALRSASRRR
jgi:predicted 3-demethylubiquinone-9 3-methyltransferase (glyoxalase superfamily)